MSAWDFRLLKAPRARYGTVTMAVMMCAERHDDNQFNEIGDQRQGLGRRCLSAHFYQSLSTHSRRAGNIFISMRRRDKRRLEL
jgi:hypothetical protein